jgi:hypothetical protein
VLVTLATDPALAAEALSATAQYQWLVWVAGILVHVDLEKFNLIRVSAV